MSIYKEFNDLYPYIQSVRKLKNYLSFDMSFPRTWKLPKKYVKEDSVIENESSDKSYRLISFVSQFEEESINNIAENIKNIIKYNKELEAKEKLFNDKVNELKSLFEKQNLQSLNELKFEISPKKYTLNGEDDENTINNNGKKTGMVEEWSWKRHYWIRIRKKNFDRTHKKIQEGGYC